MCVWWIEAARLVEQACDSDIKASKGSKLLSGGSDDHTTFALSYGSICSRVQIKLDDVSKGSKSKKKLIWHPYLEVGGSVALGILQQRNAVSSRRCCDKVGDELRVWWRVGGCSRVAEGSEASCGRNRC